MSTPSSTSIDAKLAELLSLHLMERELMQAQKHEEHMLCVERKMELARSIEAWFKTSPALDPIHLELVSSIKSAALANAQIAEKMLRLSKGKMDLIRSICAPSYDSGGRASQSGGSGSLLDLKA